MFDVFALPIEKQFSRRLIKPDTWILNGFVMGFAPPHPHVIVGEKFAAVIDTTDLFYNVREYVEKVITDKPLVTISTHSHFDHTSNNYQFEDCPQYMSRICAEEIIASRSDPNPRHPVRGTYTPIVVEDGDVIDLGGRQIECIDFCGCHSPSSMAYLDLQYGCLFTGDEFEGGQVLIGGRAGSKNCVELYRDNLVKLKARVEGRATCICPPHNGSPMDISMLDNMIENCNRIMDGHEGNKEIGSMSFGLNPLSYHDAPFGEVGWVDNSARLERYGDTGRRSEWKGASLVYDAKRIFYTDVE